MKILLTLLSVLFSSQLLAADKLRILDRGMDGNKRYYTITCADGSTGSIWQEFNFDAGGAPSIKRGEILKGGYQSTNPSKVSVIKVCVLPNAGEDICRDGDWQLDKAARLVCQ